MKHQWFFFTPAADGFDIIVRDTGADNGTILAEGSLRGENFKKFVDDVLFEGLKSLEPEEIEAIKESPEELQGDTAEALGLNEVDVVEEVRKQGWFGGKS